VTTDQASADDGEVAALADTVADLMHLADEKGVAWETVIDRAQHNYDEDKEAA
jgi:hypothetical protein